MTTYRYPRIRIGWCGLRDANEIPAEDRWGNYLIRIGENPEALANREGWAGVCDVYCADIPMEKVRNLEPGSEPWRVYHECYRLFDETDARRIWAFVGGIPDGRTLWVHCGAGISRSAAVAAAIVKVLTGDDTHVFNGPRVTSPNVWIYGTMIAQAPYTRFSRKQQRG